MDAVAARAEGGGEDEVVMAAEDPGVGGIVDPPHPSGPVRRGGEHATAAGVERQDLDREIVAFEKPAAGTIIEELVPAVEQRTPKALTGNAAEIAAQVVNILKNEAKVI